MYSKLNKKKPNFKNVQTNKQYTAGLYQAQDIAYVWIKITCVYQFVHSYIPPSTV